MTIVWEDAVHLARAARREGTTHDAFRMLRTDAWFLLALFRMRRACLKLRIPVLNRVLRLMQMVFGGIELGNDIVLGRGVYLVHSLGTVIGGRAVVGDRVRFLGNNTVGTARDNGHPVIEDDVEVGCGARILGPVCVGRGAVIGANAVVLSDVPAYAVAVGAPARVVGFAKHAPQATPAPATERRVIA